MLIPIYYDAFFGIFEMFGIFEGFGSFWSI